MIFCILFSLLAAKYWTENYESVLYQPYFFKSRYYRIPAITTAKDGSLIAATDMRWVNKNDLPARISTTIRISPDDGFSWTDNQIISGPVRNVGDGDPSLVTDRKTGTIICLWNGDVGFLASTQSNPQHIYVSRSFDNGRTWEPKRDITSSIYSNLCTNCSQDRYTWSSMFISSGAILQLRDGRIMAAGVTRCWGQTRIYSVYSDDIGLTWTASEYPACKTADESKFFERNDGVVVASVRHKPTRLFSFSPDRGMTWENETAQPDVWDSPCNGEVIRYTSTIDGYDKNRILHTVTYVQNFPRRNVSLLLSYDEGKTWPIKKTLRGDPNLLGSYSAISIGHSGLIHVYYEKGTDEKDWDSFNMTVHTVSLEWLTDGKDTYKKAENLQWCVCEKDDAECNSICPDGYYRSTGQIFDQYVESYFEYPTNMRYVFPRGCRDFAVNLSVPGLRSATYSSKYEDSNKRASGHRPSITFNGLNNLDDEDEAGEKEFILENVDASVDFNQLYHNKFVLKGSSTLTVLSNVTKIEAGKTQARLTSGSLFDTKSNVVQIDDSKAKLIVLNDIQDQNKPLEIFNGIENTPGQDSANIGLVVTAAKPNTRIKIVGDWSNDEAKKVTISSPGSNTKTVVVTNSANKDKFTINGAQPEFQYIYPTQTITTTNEPTTVPSKEPSITHSSLPSKEPTSAPPSKVSSSEVLPSVQPTHEITNPNKDNNDSDKQSGSKNNTTLMIVAIIVAVIAICVIILVTVIFIKMKKNKSIPNMKSENPEPEPLRAPLLF